MTTLTDNEAEFLRAAAGQEEFEGAFCYPDTTCYGYSGSVRKAQATFGSVVAKGMAEEPIEGWSCLTPEGKAALRRMAGDKRGQ